MLFQTLQDKEWSGFLTQFGVYIVIGIFFTLATVYQLFFMQWLSLTLSYSMRRASRLHEVPECELHRLAIGCEKRRYSPQVTAMPCVIFMTGLSHDRDGPEISAFDDLQSRKRWPE